MAFTKEELRQRDKEELITLLIDFQKSNKSLANKMCKASEKIEEADKYLTFN